MSAGWWAAACWLLPSIACAHARPPALNSFRIDRHDGDHFVAQATWGAAVTRDGGATWRWMCASVLGVDARFEDPSMRLGYEGRVLAGTLDGLLISDAAGCEWAPVPGELGSTWVIDIGIDPSDPLVLYAVATDVTFGDQLYRSDDEGRSWSARGEAFEGVLLAGIQVAPSRPQRIYLSADVPGLPADRQTLVLRSDDGGLTYDRFRFVDLAPTERVVRIRAVDPRDPDVLYAVVFDAATVMDPHRLIRSGDGGETFETVLTAPQLGDVVIDETGQRVLVGSRLGGVFRSDDRGLTFAQVHPDLPVSCLRYAAGRLHACTDGRAAGFALATSDDWGQSWSPILRLDEIRELVPCPTCSGVGVVCPAWLPDVSFDLRFDAGLTVDLEPDGGVGLPRDSGLPPECGGPPAPDGGCGCRLTARSDHARWWLLLFSLVALRARVRRER